MRARFTIGDHLVKHLLINQRLVFRIGQRVRWAIHSLVAMAAGAVLAVERSKIGDRIGTRHLWPGLGTPGKLFAAQYSETRNQHQAGTKEARGHFGPSSRWCSSIIP